ncbi:MAG: ATP-binding protein [Verrucomicrobiota bacterium]
MSVLIPWSLWETMILWLGTLFLYTVACLAHSQIINIEVSFFIFLTGLACVISTYLASKARLKDFLLRQQLNERNDELQRLDQQKTQFFSNISHELRTPLTLILSPIQDLLHKSEKLPDQVHKTLLLAMQNSLRLLKLINDLLEVTRLEQAEFKADFKRIEAGGMVKSLAHSIRHLAIAKEIKLQIEGAKEPLWILGDLSLLEKVFLNLFTNAIKFTKEGGVIYVRCRKDGEQVFFEVEDTGIGIPEKELPNIFDRFHQVDGSSTRKYQGVGIGLSLVRDLVHKHGGKIEVKSEEGKGTCFQICLKGAPAQTDEEAVTLSTQTSSIPKASQDPLLAAFKSADRFLVHHEESEALPEIGQGEFTLLVVDDEPDMRRFITSTVSEKYTIIQAADGVSGLELAKARRPHLILLDWMLPGMSGPEVCKKIKGDKETRGIKILMLTAKMDEESKIEGLNAGADDFLVKPFSTLELQSRVKNHLNTAALEADLRESNQELQQALDHLKATESQLIQSEKMNAMGNLSAGLLHEINNPLNFSLTALSFASQSLSSDDEMVREALDDIENGLGRVRDIVSDLRIFAYPDEKGSLEWVSMEEPIKSALRMLSHELNNVEFESQVCNDSIAYLCRQQITHVVINLISNSVKATKDTAAKRKPQIYLKVEKVEDEYLRLSVKDNGCGVSQETLKKVFNPFFTTREVGEGLGIGLSLCHTLVKNHKGTIDMRSKEGEWTEVIVTLPINPAEGKDDSRNRLLQSI